VTGDKLENGSSSKETKVPLERNQIIPKVRGEELTEVIEAIASKVGPQAKDIINTIYENIRKDKETEQRKFNNVLRATVIIFGIVALLTYFEVIPVEGLTPLAAFIIGYLVKSLSKS